MTDDSADDDVKHQLRQLVTSVGSMNAKLECLLNGGSGQPGVYVRMSKIEQGQGFLWYCYGWLVAGGAAIGWMVMPGYFRGDK